MKMTPPIPTFHQYLLEGIKARKKVLKVNVFESYKETLRQEIETLEAAKKAYEDYCAWYEIDQKTW